MRLTYETITPEVAKEILKGNTHNRKMRKSTMYAYLSDMQSGHWCQLQDLVEPIYISKDGTLLNGQHRLTALVTGNITVKMYVVRDCNPEIYKYLDGGEKRRAADQLPEWVKNKAGVSSLARFIVAAVDYGASIQSALGGKTTGGWGRVTRSEVIDYVEANNEILQEIFNEGAKASMSLIGTRRTAVMIPGFIARYIGMGEEYKKFAAELSDPVSYVDSVQICKGTIQRMVMKSKGSLSDTYIIGTMLMAFDAYYSGKTVGALNKQDKYLQKYSALIKARNAELADAIWKAR